MIGPSWYKIEVVYEQTGLQAPGEFSKLDALSEASICRQNVSLFNDKTKTLPWYHLMYLIFSLFPPFRPLFLKLADHLY